MADRTFITQHDLDLVQMIEMIHAQLKSWKIDIEVHASSNPLSHLHTSHVNVKGCTLISADGNGPTAECALADALNKLISGLGCNTFFDDYYLGEEIGNGDFVHYPDEKWFVEDEDEDERPEGLLDEMLWDFYDPDEDLDLEDIFDFNSGAGERGVCALPFTRHSDNETIFFPVNFITNLYGDSGTGAGRNSDEARTKALLVLLSRYIEKRVIEEKISLPTIPKEVISRFSHSELLMEQLESEGFRLQTEDASLGGTFPVVSVTLIHPEDGNVVVAFGAALSLETALEQALRKILHRRGFEQNDDVKVPAFTTEQFTDATVVLPYAFFNKEADYAFVDWNHDVERGRASDYLCDLLQADDFEVYLADYDYLDLHTCRVIVPKMSECYPVENLVWHNNNEGAFYRASLLSLGSLDESEWARILENLEDEGLDDTLKVARFIGIAPNPDTRWASLQVGTLKGMLALALEDYDKALAWNNWTLRHADLSRKEKVSPLHRCAPGDRDRRC